VAEAGEAVSVPILCFAAGPMIQITLYGMRAHWAHLLAVDKALTSTRISDVFALVFGTLALDHSRSFESLVVASVFAVVC
jgi:hypothetical protein